MFNQPVDERLSAWASYRGELDKCKDPLRLTCDFWRFAPFIPYNKDIDPYNQRDWPTPWEIIVENRYDDFTKALMMAWSLKYTKRYKDSKIEIKTLVDCHKNCYYNIVCVDDTAYTHIHYPRHHLDPLTKGLDGRSCCSSSIRQVERVAD